MSRGMQRIHAFVPGLLVTLAALTASPAADQGSLADAMKADDQAAARALLNRDSDPNARGADSSTPLY